MLTARDLAALLAIGRRTLQSWRATGKLPPPDVAIGKILRWRRKTIENWITANAGDRI
jgi:predicted DNA-binding transcriptional regulator AlpA